MVKKIGILGFILIVVAATGMVWAETYTGAIPAPQPMVMPAAAPACVGAGCAPHQLKMKAPESLRRLTTSIEVKMQYPAPPMMACPPPMYGPAGCAPPPPFRGGPHVEVHRALATLCLLPACRISRKI